MKPQVSGQVSSSAPVRPPQPPPVLTEVRRTRPFGLRIERPGQPPVSSR
jgi:hypothetical protein